MKQTKIIDMTQGSIVKGLVLYSIPIILSDLLQQLYNSADSIIVGQFVGKEALAAVGQSFFLINMLLGLFLGIGLGSTVVVSRFFGARNKEGMASAVNTILRLTAILCVLFTAAGILLVPYLLKFVGTTADVYDDAKAYLTIYMAGIGAQLMYNILAGLLKSIGDSRRPLYVLAFTASLNVVLDLFFIAVLHLGVAGAALATIIAQIVSSTILWRIMVKTPEFEKPLVRKEKMNLNILKDIFVIGLPYAVQKSIIALSNTMVVSYVNYFGSTSMAAWTAYQKIDMFVIATIISLGAATTTFVAQNVGAQRYERINKGVNASVALSTIVASIYAVFFYVFRFQAIGLFNEDPDVIAIGARLLSLLMTVHIVNSVPQIYSGALRGLGESLRSTMVFIINYVFLRQIYLFFRWQYMKDIINLVAGYHLTWLTCSIMMTILYYRTIAKYKKLSKVEGIEK